MHEFTFKALGTIWRLSHDGAPFANADTQNVCAFVDDFEKRFSRFLSDSEVNAFRKAEAGTYTISDEFATLLAEANRLRELTAGMYDPAAGELLERAGYDAAYRMQPEDNTKDFTLPQWQLDGTALTIAGPTAFDLGGIGKGYCIDRVAELLISLGYAHIAVEAGGDMFVTTKHDGSPWNTAIQYPGKEDTAAGTIKLSNEALAVSDSFRRKWSSWHHIVDPHQNKAVDHVVGAAAVAPNAWHADCMTSALFLAPHDALETIAHTYNAPYIYFGNDGACRGSNNWKGDMFTPTSFIA